MADDKANDEALVRALGWFSIGLGLAQVAAPSAFAQLIGLRGDGRAKLLTRLVGVREMTAGVGLLTQRRSAGWLWARVGGDVMDLALLGSAFGSRGVDRGRLAAAAAGVAGVMLPDLSGAVRLSRPSRARDRRAGAGSEGRAERRERAAGVSVAATVNRPADEVYRFWRDYENLPRFMKHVAEVREIGEGRSHWRAKGPLGATMEWDAEIVEDQPNLLIAWRSVDGGDMKQSGSVRFTRAPGGHGTEVRLELRYEPAAGPFGAVRPRLAGLWGTVLRRKVLDDLRVLKQLLEAGEVVHSEATIHGRPHPARPPERLPQDAGGPRGAAFTPAMPERRAA
ncbi:MAG TPA: SRPBCC family protein [Chloroflexota bacterium]|nr:SRPBCC family protein [Chloroflexota bacterium]